MVLVGLCCVTVAALYKELMNTIAAGLYT
jgi:hypothetical protein